MLLILALLCGCGAAQTAAPANEATAAPEPTAETKQSTVRVITDVPATASAPAETAAPAEAAPAEAPAETPAQEAPDADSPMQRALACVGETTTELYAAIGYPESSDYASSCLGSGEDGNLYYDGFTVYTYREDGVETVRHVE